jgi:hypothetical protein
MSSDKGKILVVSHDPRLVAVRKSVPEAAGFQVIPTSDDAAVRKFWRKHKPKLLDTRLLVLKKDCRGRVASDLQSAHS